MIERIKELIRNKGLSASGFADEIGVQRSGISHILSGRNKPSLEFVLKILDAYPEINTDWLIKGKGNMLNKQSDLFTDVESKPEPEKTAQIKETESSKAPSTESQEINRQNDSASEIEKIIILYKDNSFKEYNPGR